MPYASNRSYPSNPHGKNPVFRAYRLPCLILPRLGARIYHRAVQIDELLSILAVSTSHLSSPNALSCILRSGTKVKAARNAVFLLALW
jgi:hypothetical protein